MIVKMLIIISMWGNGIDFEIYELASYSVPMQCEEMLPIVNKQLKATKLVSTFDYRATWLLVCLRVK